MVKAQLLITAAAVAAVGAFSPNAPQTVRSTKRVRSGFRCDERTRGGRLSHETRKNELGLQQSHRSDETQ